MKTLICLVATLSLGACGADAPPADGGPSDVPVSDGGATESDGGSFDGGSFDGGASDGGSFDAGSVDAGAGRPDASTPPPPVDTVDWLVPARVWSGSPETIEVTLRDGSGAPVDTSGTTVTLDIASGTSTAVLGAATDLGSGRLSFSFRGLEEGSAVRLDVRVGGALLDALSPEIEIIVPLLHYTPAGATRTISEIRSNLSGHAWNPDSGQFMLIRNNDRQLHVLDADLSHLAALTLRSNPIGSDLEDIVYLGGSAGAPEYALVDENGRAAIGTIPAGSTTALDMSTWQSVRYASNPAVGNKGGEGIAHDPATGRMWVCTERSPMIIYGFMRPAPGADVSFETGFAVTQPFDADASLRSEITDISSCLFDPRTQRLLVLSHESSRLVDVDWDGTVIATYDVDGAPQFEGVTLIADRDMLLSSEANRIRSYTYGGPVP